MDEPRLKPGLAFALSLVPGVGHVYAGRMGGALFWLMGVSMAYRASVRLGVLTHLFCAFSAAAAARRARDEEARSIAGRRESPEEVDRMLRRVGRASPDAEQASAALAVAAAIPSDRRTELPAAYALPVDVLRTALLRGMASERFLGVREEPDGTLTGRVLLDGGGSLPVTASVEVVRAAHGAGGVSSRVRLTALRATDAPEERAAAEALLRAVLRHIEAEVAARSDAAVPPPPPSDAGAGSPVTEDVFLDRLAEAWEAREQGWMPDAEWRARKARLIDDLVLRGGTRVHDFMAVCRPLQEAGVLEADDLRAIERSVGR